MSHVLSVGLLAGLPVEPGLEGVIDLQAEMCNWSVPCRFIVRQPGDLVLTVEVWTPHHLVQHIDLTSVLLASGGASYFFRCPGLRGTGECGRRVRNLHLPAFGAQALACRRCHGLSYRSQHTQVRTLERMMAWIEREKARIGYPGTDVS